MERTGACYNSTKRISARLGTPANVVGGAAGKLRYLLPEMRRFAKRGMDRWRLADGLFLRYLLVSIRPWLPMVSFLATHFRLARAELRCLTCGENIEKEEPA